MFGSAFPMSKDLLIFSSADAVGDGVVSLFSLEFSPRIYSLGEGSALSNNNSNLTCNLVLIFRPCGRDSVHK